VGRFPVFTDNHVQTSVIHGLRQRGWSVVRAVDVFPENTVDDVLFEHAARDGRVLVTNDRGIHRLGVTWLEAGRPFAGLVFWAQEDYASMTTGDLIRAFEALAAQEDPFAYPIRTIRPPDRSALRERFKRPRRRTR